MGGGSVTAEGRGELAQLVSNQVMVIADADDKNDGDEADDGHKQDKSLFAYEVQATFCRPPHDQKSLPMAYC